MKIKIDNFNYNINLDKKFGIFELQFIPCFTIKEEEEYYISDNVINFLKSKNIKLKKPYTKYFPKKMKDKNDKLYIKEGCGLYYGTIYSPDEKLINEIIEFIKKLPYGKINYEFEERIKVLKKQLK